jgi:hypothetical protein
MKKLSPGWILFLIADTALVIAIIIVVLNKG